MADEDNPFAHLHAGGAPAPEDNPFSHLMAPAAPNAPAEDSRDVRVRQATEKARGIQTQQPGFNPDDDATQAAAQQQGIATQLQPNDLQHPTATGEPAESAIEATDRGGRLQRMMSAARGVIHSAGIAPPDGQFGAADVSAEASGKTQFGKGLQAGAAGVEQIAPAFQMLASSNAMKTWADELEKVDNEASGPYAGFSPEQREGARQGLVKQIAGNKETLGASLKVWQAYASEQQANSGRVASVTDVKDVADFRDWLSHTAGASVASLAPIILASVIPVVGGVAAGAGLTAQTIAQEAGRTIGGIAPPGSALEAQNRDQAGEAHQALERDKGAIAGASIINSALNMFGPLGRTATKIEPALAESFAGRTAIGAVEQAGIGVGQTVTSAAARGEPVSGKDVAEQAASGLLIGGTLGAAHEPTATKTASKSGAIPPSGGRIEPTMGKIEPGPAFDDVKGKMRPDEAESGSFVTPNGAHITPDMWDSAPAARRQAWMTPKAGEAAGAPATPATVATVATEKGLSSGRPAEKEGALAAPSPIPVEKASPPGQNVPRKGVKVTEEPLPSVEGEKPPPKVSTKGMKTEELPVQELEGHPVAEPTPETEQVAATSAGKEDAESRIPVAPGEGIKAEGPPSAEAAPISRQKSPLLKGLAEMGLHPDTMSDLGVDAGRRRIVKGERSYTKAGKLQVARASRTTQDPMIVGGRKLFREGGSQIDEVVGHLQDQGYMPRDYEHDWGQDADHAKAEMAGDIVRRELERPGSVKKWADEEVNQQDRASREQDETGLTARADELGIEHQGRDIEDVRRAVTDAEHQNWLEKHESDEVTGERAQRALVAHSIDPAAVERAAIQHQDNDKGFHAAIDQILSAHASEGRGAPGPAARRKRGAQDHGHGEVREPAAARARAGEGVPGEAGVHGKDEAAGGAAGRAYSRGAVEPEHPAGTAEERGRGYGARPAGQPGALERAIAGPKRERPAGETPEERRLTERRKSGWRPDAEGRDQHARLRTALEVAPEATRRALDRPGDAKSLDEAVKRILRDPEARKPAEAQTPEQTKQKLRDLGYTDLADFEPGEPDSVRQFARGEANERQEEMFPTEPMRGSTLRKGEVEVTAAPGVVKPASLRDRIKFLGSRTAPVTIKKLPTAGKIRSSKEVAALLAPMASQTQENMMFVVTGKNDQPLAVIRHTLGGRSFTQNDMMSAAGAIGEVAGAVKVWPAHNHPSGAARFSERHDTQVQDKLQRVFAGTGLQLQDHTILTPQGSYQGWRSINPMEGVEMSRGFTPPATGAKTIPVLERQYTQLGAGPLMNGPKEAGQLLAHISKDASGREQPGFLLLNHSNEPLAYLPMAAEEMQRLRTGSVESGAMAILRAGEMTGATTLVAHMPDSTMQESAQASHNINAFGSSFGMTVMDVLSGKGERKGSLSGLDIIGRGAGGEYKARGATAEPHASPEAFRAEAERSFGKQALAAMEEQGLLNIRSAADFGQAEGTGRAFYEDGKGVFFWDKIPKGEVAGVIAHEIGVHHGMRRLMGDEGYDRLIADMKSASDPAVAAARAHVDRLYTAADFENAGGRDEEVLARLVETAPQHGLVQRIVDAVRSFLYRNFGVGKFDEGLARALAASAIRATVHGEFSGPPHWREAQAYTRDAATVDPAERDMHGPGWYSELARQVELVPSNVMKPADWVTRISTLKGGVRAEEIRATGVADWLAMKDPNQRVPRQDVVDWVRNNGPSVHETVLGEDEGQNAAHTRARGRVQELAERMENATNHVEQSASDLAGHLRALKMDSDRVGRGEKAGDALDALQAAALGSARGQHEPLIADYVDRYIGRVGLTVDQQVAVRRSARDRLHEVVELTKVLAEDRRFLKELRLDHAGAKRNLADFERTMHTQAQRPERQDKPQGASQFERWKVADGGKSYREILLTTPDRRNPAHVEALRRADEKWQGEGRAPERWVASAELNTAAARAGPTEIYITHFHRPDEPEGDAAKVANNIAHMRGDTRVDGEGKRTSFWHEFQSDWAQQGAKKGFVGEKGSRTSRGKLAKLEKAFEGLDPDAPVPQDFADRLAAAYTEADKPGTVSTGPYVGSTAAWAGLVARRALRYAVANGHERVSWTTGSMVNRMFGLANRVHSIAITTPSPGRYDLHVRRDNAELAQFAGHSMTRDRLAEHIGEELADRLVAEAAADPKGMATLTGERMIDSRQGRGNRKFYDEIMPKVMADELRAMGVKQKVRSDIPLAAGTKDHNGTPMGTAVFPGKVHGVDITPEIIAAVTPGVRQYARGRQVQEVPKPKVLDNAIKPQTSAEKWEERLYNSFNRVFQAHEQVQAASGPTGEHADVPLAVGLFPGRVEHMGEQIRTRYLEPLAEIMGKTFKAEKLTGKDLSEWLYAEHAPQRNAYIGKLRGEAGGWSGMTNEQAAAVRDGFTTAQQQALTDAAAHVYAMNDAMLQHRVDSGLITQQVADNMRGAFGSKYVPLRDLDMEEQHYRGTGQGFEVGSSGVQAAMGRKSRAGDPLANSILQASRAALMGEKASVDRAIWNFAQIPEAQKIITPVDESTAWKYFKTMVSDPGAVPKIQEGGPGNWMGRDEVMRVRVDGQTKYLLVRDEKLREQLRNVADSEAINPLLQAIGRVTHGIGRLLTEYNPSFTIPNAIRDAVTMAIRAGAYPGISRAGVVAGIGPAYADIIGSMRGDLTRPGSQAYREFQEQGGMTGAYGIRDAVDIYRDLESMGARLGNEHGRNVAQAAFHETFGRLAHWLSVGNQVVEYATRLSFYKAMRETGASPARAAMEAKKITINFNQHGTWGRQANQALVFTNAALQAVYGAYQYAKFAPVRRALYALAATSIATELWNWYVGGVDPETGERNITKVSQGKADSSMILLWPNSSAGLSLPLPQEYGAIWALPRHALRAVLVPASERGTELSGAVGAAITNLVPTRVSDQASSAPEAIAKTVTPTILGAPLDVLTNENFFGARIYSPQTYQDPRAPLPYWVHARPSTSDVSRGISHGLNWATGGDDVTPGKAQDWLGPFMAPEAMDYLTGSYLGGVGILAAQSTNLARAAVTGDTDAVELRRTPVLGRLGFTNQDSYVGRRYNDLAGDYLREKQYQAEGTDRPDSPYTKTLDEFEAAEKELAPLFKNLRQAQAAGAKEDAKSIRDEIRQTQAGVVKAYNEARQ